MRSVVENSSENVTVVDPDGTLRYASPAFGRMLGYDPEEAVGTMNVLDHVHPEDLSHALEETQKALLDGGVTTNKAEYRFRHKDGSWRWVESVGTYLLDDPDVKGVVVQTRDITERKEAEEALRRSEAEIFSILESITDGFFTLDREWRFAYVNPQGEVLLEKSKEDLVGEKIREDPTFYPRYREAAVEGKTVRFEGYYAPLGKWYSVRAYPSSSGLSVYFHDVTERKRAEEKIRFQAQLLGAVGEAVIALDVEGRVIYWNRGAEEIYGWSSEEVMGRLLKEMVVPEGLRERAEDLAAQLREGKGWTGEFAVRRKDGTAFLAEGTYSPVFGKDGDVNGVIGVLRNVTERNEAEEALKEAEERYRTLIEQVPIVTYIDKATDGPDEPIYTSPQIERLLGYSPEEWLEGHLWLERLHPEDKERILAADERFEAGGEPFSEEYRLLARDGSVVWVREDAALIRDEEGVPLYFQGVILDITKQKEAEEALRESEERLHMLSDAAFEGILINDLGVILEANRALTDMFGYEVSEVIGRSTVEFVVPEHRDLVEQKIASGAEEPYEVTGVRKDGTLLELEVRGRAYSYRGRRVRIAAIRDITDRKAAEKRLEHLAFHDWLTDLPNRQLLLDRVEHALQRTRRLRGRRVAVLLMDLDNFKGVNDSLGHGTGDYLLVAVVERLKGCLRPEDTLTRFGGDEFVVLLEDVEGSEVAVRVAERIVDELNDPFVLEGREVYVSASIGIALGEDQSKTPEDLLRDADTAMYWTKERGSDYSEFDPAMDNRALRRLEAANHLRRAIEQQEFVVHYQPIVSLQTGAVLAMEALVRWEHPEKGPLDPNEFVALAEESGLMVPIGEWVLREACRRAKEWQEVRLGTPPLVMSVNLSVKQLSRPDLTETVEAILKEAGLEGLHLALDITETVYAKALVGNTAALDSLRKLGVKISLDDFGTGFSSLSYLKRLPADVIKIDKSFVKGLGEDAEDTAIVRMIIELAHTLGLEVVAEGVESEEQAQQLREIGCDMGQGFYFAKPLPPEAASEYVAN